MLSKRKRIMKSKLSLLLCILLSITLWSNPKVKAATKPNIIVFYVDDMGWTDLACYGSLFYESPNLDAFKQQSVKFTSAYAACPVCSPSRASLLTGKSPARLHVTNWIGATATTGRVLSEPNWQKSLPSSEITIPEVLSAYGYTSACIGKWHLADDSNNQPSPTGQGFNTAIGIAVAPKAGQPDGYFYPYGDPNLPPGFTGEYLTDRLADEAEAFITNNQSGPFFLYLSNYAVHTPIQSKPEYETYFNNKVVPPGSTHPVGSNGRKYAGMIKSVDDSFGRVIAKLNALGIANNTIVIFTSDNGGLTSVTANSPLKQGKGWSYEGGTRVPLMIKWPGVTTGGTTNSAPVIGWDIAPTIFEMAQVDSLNYPANMDGLSMAPLLRGQTINREAVYWHFPHYRTESDNQPFGSIREGNYKLIEFYEYNVFELYDLSTDQGETNNLASTMPAKVQSMWTKLNNWRTAVGAQMPGGYSPPNFGAIVVEDTSSSINYNGTWYLSTEVNSHGGSHKYANVAGAYADFTFTGTSIKFYSKQGPGAGIANIYLDNLTTPAATFDGYNSAHTFQVLAFERAGLTSGTHTIRVGVSGSKNASSSGIAVNLDYFSYTNSVPTPTPTPGPTSSSTPTPTPTPTPIPTPTPTATIVEDNNAAVVKSGTWTTNNDTNSHGGTHSYSNVTNNYAEVTFNGTSIKYYGKKGPLAGIASIYVDNMTTPVAQWDGYASAHQYQILAYENNSLGAGSHKIRVKVSGTKNASSTGYAVNVDYFVYQ